MLVYIAFFVSINGYYKACTTNYNYYSSFFYFHKYSTGQITLDFHLECEMLNPDGNSIEIKGLGQGVVDAQ